jgi:hypothetical protein
MLRGVLAAVLNSPDVIAISLGFLGALASLLVSAYTFRQKSAEYRDSHRRVRIARQRLYRAQRKYATAQVNLEAAARELALAEEIAHDERLAGDSKRASYEAAAQLLQQRVGRERPPADLDEATIRLAFSQLDQSPSVADESETKSRHRDSADAEFE